MVKVDKISPKIDKMGLSDDMLYRWWDGTIIKNWKYKIFNRQTKWISAKWETSKDGKFLLRYPTVYIINDKKRKMILKFMLVRLEILKVGQDSTSMRIQKSKHFGKNFQNQIILQCMSLDMNYLISH